MAAGLRAEDRNIREVRIFQTTEVHKYLT
jgi:hypothetical protein